VNACQSGKVSVMGTCRWENGHACTDGPAQCQNGLCSGVTGNCVPMCGADESNNGSNICLINNGSTCHSTPSHCLSGLCQDGDCIGSCTGGRMSVGGTCQCPADQAVNSSTGNCAQIMGSCTAGANCSSNLCNITGGGGSCIDACPAAKPADGMGRCVCSGAHQEPDGDTGCRCQSGFAADMMGACKTDIGGDCTVDGDCASGHCNGPDGGTAVCTAM
jgi:hypothetical protein